MGNITRSPRSRVTSKRDSNNYHKYEYTPLCLQNKVKTMKTQMKSGKCSKQGSHHDYNRFKKVAQNHKLKMTLKLGSTPIGYRKV